MPQCAVVICNNYYGKTKGSHVIYHMWPTCPKRSAKWLELCGTSEPGYSRVCSEHFSEKCYKRDLEHELLGLPLRRKLKKDALPDRRLPGRKNNCRKENNLQGNAKKRNSKESLPKNISNSKENVIDNNDSQKQEVVLKDKNKNIEGNDSQNLTEGDSEDCIIIDEKDTKPTIIDEEPNKKAKDKESFIIIRRSNKTKLPMRSSIRIAKKKSIESLSDSFTTKINNKTNQNFKTKAEKFSDKLKFLAKLELKLEQRSITLTPIKPTSQLDHR